MVEDLKLFQARKQVFLKQFLKRKFGVHFPISLRQRVLYVVLLSRGSYNVHSIFRLCTLRYCRLAPREDSYKQYIYITGGRVREIV